MSLDAQTADGKTLVFRFPFDKDTISLYDGKNRIEWGYNDFCRKLHEGWDSYLNRETERIPLGSHTFKSWPDFAGITEYFLSHAGAVRTDGYKLDPYREKTLYWLKARLEKQQDKRLQLLNQMLGQA